MKKFLILIIGVVLTSCSAEIITPEPKQVVDAGRRSTRLARFLIIDTDSVHTVSELKNI